MYLDHYNLAYFFRYWGRNMGYNSGINVPALKNLVFGNNVTNIYDCFDALYGSLSNLETLVLGNNIVNMRYAFWNCRLLKTEATVTASATDAERAYQYGYNITNINALNSNKLINAYGVFLECNNAHGIGYVGPQVRNCYRMYMNCRNLDEAFIHAGAGYGNSDFVNNHDGIETFYGCNNIKKITFWSTPGTVSNNFANAKDRWFNNCNISNVTELVLHENVWHMYSAFWGCQNATFPAAAANNCCNWYSCYSGSSVNTQNLGNFWLKNAQQICYMFN